MTDRKQLLETAIRVRVELNQREWNGQPAADFLNRTVQPAVQAAYAAGWTPSDVHDEASRRYGKWLAAGGGRD